MLSCSVNIFFFHSVAFGATAGQLMACVGIPVPMGAAANGGGKLGACGLNYLHNTISYSKKAKTVVRFVNKGTTENLEYFDAAKQKKLLVQVLVEAALHIFEIYEYQFMKIAANDILRSIDKLSYDAACRAVNYIVLNAVEDQIFSAEVLIKGVLLGVSKKSNTAKVTVSTYGKKGLTVATDTETWNTAKLFGDIAVRGTIYNYVKDSSDKSMGARLPADLSDFEHCGSDLESWLQQNGYTMHDWTMEKDYPYVATTKILTEIGDQAIQQIEKSDSVIRFDKIENQIDELKANICCAKENLQDLKSGISEINAIVSSTAPVKELSFKPIPEPHAAFTGRDHFVNSAVEYLLNLQPNLGDFQIKFPCLVIHALGGYGKTQTARKIVSKCRKHNHFQHFIWIDAEDEISIANSFFAVMKQAKLVPSGTKSFDATNIQPFLHNFYDLLVKTINERFLLIFDNVEDFNQIFDYLPLNYGPSNIAVLITSQRQCQIGESFGNVKNELLDLISPEEAIALVEKVLGKSSMDSAEEKTLLTERSGRIPLILHLMASTIKFQRKYKPEYTIGKYLGEITLEPIQYVDQPEYLHLGYKKSLRQIVNFAIAKLNAIAGTIGQFAVKIFDRVAYCSPTGNRIPYIVETYLRDIKKEADNLDHHLPLKPDGFQIIQMAIELLSEFSLVQCSDMRFTIHRLVQASRRLDLKDAGLEKDILNNSMSALPNVSCGRMKDSHGTLSIWYHVADYADLTNKYYPVKGTLIEFTRYGAIDVVKKIIDVFGLNRSVKNIIAEYKYDYYKHCPNPMEIAIETGNQEMIDLYAETIRKYREKEPKDFETWTREIHDMIMAAIAYSTIDVVKQLVDILGIDVNKTSSKYLDAAIFAEKLDLVLWLIKDKSCIPLASHLQKCIKNVEITKVIIMYLEKNQPNLALNEIIEERSGKNLLICLLNCGGPCASNDTVQILLEKGLDPAISDKDGWNALHYAAWENNLFAIDLILSRDPIPGAPQAKWTPMLIESKNNNGWTPLICAARIGQCEATNHLLKKYSADIDAMDPWGYTALTNAIHMHQLPVVKILLSNRAKTSTKTNSKPTVNALHEAVKFLVNDDSSESVQIVDEIIVARGCDISATDVDGNNVLHLLARHYYASKETPNNSVLNSILAANPMLVNVQNNDGFTPLQLAKHLLEEDRNSFGWHVDSLTDLINQLGKLSANT